MISSVVPQVAAVGGTGYLQTVWFRAPASQPPVSSIPEAAVTCCPAAAAAAFVQFSGVDEVDARLQRVVQLLKGLRLGVLFLRRRVMATSVVETCGWASTIAGCSIVQHRSLLTPHVMVPRQTTDTRRSELPSVLYCMVPGFAPWLVAHRRFPAHLLAPIVNYL